MSGWLTSRLNQRAKPPSDPAQPFWLVGFKGRHKQTLPEQHKTHHDMKVHLGELLWSTWLRVRPESKPPYLSSPILSLMGRDTPSLECTSWKKRNAKRDMAMGGGGGGRFGKTEQLATTENYQQHKLNSNTEGMQHIRHGKSIWLVYIFRAASSAGKDRRLPSRSEMEPRSPLAMDETGESDRISMRSTLPHGRNIESRDPHSLNQKNHNPTQMTRVACAFP